MPEELYRKHVSEKGKVSYRPYVPPAEPDQVVELTSEQIITLGVAASVTAMELLQRHLKPHQLVARKIRACEQAIYDLAQGTGGKVGPAIIDSWLEQWNLVTVQLQAKAEDISNERNDP